MPTTLYFALNTASVKEPGTYPVAATNYANVTPDRNLTTEGFMIGYPWRAVANLTQSSDNRTSAQIAKFGRFYSPPFAQDYTYQHPTNSADAIKYYLADYESNLSANHCIQQCHIFVWRPSTGTVVGVIQTVSVLATGSKEPTATASIQSTLGEYFRTAGTINILKGDILVFEPFSTFSQSAATAYTIRFYYGGATQITAENTVVATPASKVVFSVDLPLEPSAGEVAGAIRYVATNELRGPRFISALKSKSRIFPVTLVDGSPFISRLKVRPQVTANLQTQVSLHAHLKSISKLTAWRQQTHELSVTLQSVSRAFATFPDQPVGESLNLYYSGNGTPENPALSIGGPKGRALGGTLFTATPLVPGVEVLAVHGMAEGIHTLKVDAVARSVSLVLVTGLHDYSAGIDEGITTVAVGSKEAGFAVVRVNAATVASGEIALEVTPAPNLLFLNPSPAAVISGETVYRCLYLFNDTDQEVLNVSLTVTDDSDEVLTMASEFTSDVSLQAHSGALTMRSRAMDPTGWGGMFFLGDNMQYASEVSANGLPLLLSSPATQSQASDGVTVQIPQVLADDTDSGGRLSVLTFTSTLSWARIPARRGVTFWVRKVQPPGPGSDIRTANFTITADF